MQRIAEFRNNSLSIRHYEKSRQKGDIETKSNHNRTRSSHATSFVTVMADEWSYKMQLYSSKRMIYWRAWWPPTGESRHGLVINWRWLQTKHNLLICHHRADASYRANRLPIAFMLHKLPLSNQMWSVCLWVCAGFGFIYNDDFLSS